MVVSFLFWYNDKLILYCKLMALLWYIIPLNGKDICILRNNYMSSRKEEENKTTVTSSTTTTSSSPSQQLQEQHNLV
jgi:hypothetical protein